MKMRSLVAVPVLFSLFLACGPLDPDPVPAEALASAEPALASKFRRAAEPVRGQYIVVLADGAPEVESVAVEQTRLAGGEVGRTFRHALRGYVLRAPEAAA